MQSVLQTCSNSITSDNSEVTPADCSNITYLNTPIQASFVYPSTSSQFHQKTLYGCVEKCNVGGIGNNMFCGWELIGGGANQQADVYAPSSFYISSYEKAVTSVMWYKIHNPSFP